MNDVLQMTYLLVAIGIVFYLLAKLIGRLFPSGEIYMYDDEHKRCFWGYLKYIQNGSKYRIYGRISGVNETCLGEIQTKKDGNAWVVFWKQEYLSESLGYVDLKGRIFTVDGKLVGYVGPKMEHPDTNGKSYWWELWMRRHADAFFISDFNRPIAHCVENGRLRKRKSYEHTILARAAAFVVLYKHYAKLSEEENYLPMNSWGDVALPSAVVFMGMYGLWYLLSPGYVLFPFIGERLSFLVAMIIVYFLIWAVLRNIKIELILSEKPIKWWLDLFNSNVGIFHLNFLIKIFATAGLLLSVFSFGGDFAPLLGVILIGIIVNERTYVQEKWKVETRFPYLPNEIPVVPPVEDKGEIELKYDWKLDSPYTEDLYGSLKLRFKQEDIDKLRLQNPFRQGNDYYNHVRKMLKEKHDERHLKIINNYIAVLGSRNDLTMLETIQFILDFVQKPNIDYKYDKESTLFDEYVRYPEETLFDKVGDCDCKAMLAAALFRNAGFSVLYITSNTHAAVAVECRPEWFSNWNNPSLRDGLIVHEGKFYYFCETTGDNFRVGDTCCNVDEFKYIINLNNL